jgi:hypothetical protein
MKHHIGWMSSISLALCACLGPQGDGFGKAPETPSTWSCNTSGSRVDCTQARSNPEKAQMAYACNPTETDATCPDVASIDGTPGLGDLLARYNANTSFQLMPWACLVTGQNQVDCLRDVGYAYSPSTGTAKGQTGNEPNDQNEPPSQSMPPSTPGSPVPPGSPPATCEGKAWETYFARIANYSYQTNGVSVTFPRSIFNIDENPAELAIQTASDQLGSQRSASGALSCAAGEIEMRAQSWIDAVMQGCVLLSPGILIMCQQGANYAPASGACNATATW